MRFLVGESVGLVDSSSTIGCRSMSRAGVGLSMGCDFSSLPRADWEAKDDPMREVLDGWRGVVDVGSSRGIFFGRSPSSPVFRFPPLKIGAFTIVSMRGCLIAKPLLFASVLLFSESATIDRRDIDRVRAEIVKARAG